MATELRDTGISVVGGAPWGSHFCCFYETKQDLLDTLVPYFKAGLDSQEFCFWVISDSDLVTLTEAKEALERAVPDLPRHLSQGNIEILNEHDWYFDKNTLDLEKVKSEWDAKLRTALARGYQGMRASADTFWLSENDWQDFFVYEKQINEWITDQTMTVMCTYPLAKSGAAEVLDVVQSHQFAIARRNGDWEVSQTSEPIQARAEITRLNEQLQRLKEHTSQQPGMVRYGAAVFSVAVALVIILWMRAEVGQPSTPIVGLFLCAVMFSAWFGGLRPGLLASILAWLAFDFYFVLPLHSLTWQIKELPRLVVFGVSALFVGSLSAAQRNRTDSLGRARDVLDETVAELKRTNQALRTENSERKNAEAQLHAKEQEFRAIVENAPDQIIRYDREFRRVYVNPAVARFYDVPAETLIGKPVGSGIRTAGPIGGVNEVALVRERIASVFDTGESCDYEMTWTSSAGRNAFSIHLFPELDLDGQVVNVLGISRDITQRMLAEDALRRSEDHLRLVIDTIPTMAWTLQPDGRLEFVNQRWLDFTGLSFAEAIADHMIIVHSEDLSSTVQKWLHVMNTGEAYEEEIRLRAADGEYRWCLVRIAPLLDEQGNIVKWYGVSFDIEERKRAEALLHTREQEFRAIVESTPDYIARYDKELRRTYVNPALAKSYGLPEESLIGKPMFSIIRDIGLDVKEDTLEDIRQGFAAVFDTGKSYEFEITLPLSPSRRDYSVRVFPELDLNGSVVNVLSIARDITESKRAEAELRKEKEILEKIFDNIPLLLAFIGEERDVTLVNPEWERTMGWTLKELREQNVDMFAEACPDLPYRQRVQDFVAAATGEWADVKIKVRDGRVMDAALVVVHLSDGTKLAIAQDITDRKRAEETIRATSEQLRALSASLQAAKEEEATRIAREVHDELGATLSSLRWYLEDVDEAISAAGGPSQIAELRQKIAAMISLTDTTVNAVRRIASELRPMALDALGLTETIEWQAREFQERTGIDVDCDCDQETSDLSGEQSTAVFRILQEALTNILRHAQASRVRIQLKVEAGEFMLKISDNGRGITQEEKCGKRTLGLLGMRERAHLVGGKLEITGSAGEGTTVIVRIRIGN
ncbi:MAG: hypothetical protein QOD33_1315 [Pyrinomonadaceae bacterium]|jgi:PAS domain S-box-containing protein|nr:hypothetical protein [Pyrinomonadaceae bacterium]